MNVSRRGRARVCSDGDAQREVQRTAGADERADELEVGARVDERPGVLLAEAEQPELVDAPAEHPLILSGHLDLLLRELRRRHISSNERSPCESVCRR